MAVLTEEMKTLVREQRLGFVATVSPDGFPNVSPKGSLTVFDDEHLVFADVESPHTVRNLAANPRIEINVVDPYSRKGYRFRGRAEILHAGDQYWKVLMMYHGEGADVRRVRSVVLVLVDQAGPLISPIYAHPVEEEALRALWEEYYSRPKKRTVTDFVPPRDF
ncbi:MAG: pyridoxamine 5'-phosphate oxidase family protein [Thermoplasmata archaeon]|nr:pyridoxamine 5'-phosphate oxidase family protein [Thermoplasmata archaeon]